MNQIGFPRPRMREEKRIAILPEDIVSFISHPELLSFERGYGNDYGLRDSDYRLAGSHVVNTKRAYTLDVLCQPKFCEADLPHMIKTDQIVFGWLHLAESDMITNELIKKNDTAIAWEEMRNQGKYVFTHNRWLTGDVGVSHGLSHGLPYTGKHISECKAAVIGRGDVGKGAIEQFQRQGPKSLDIFHSQNSQKLKEDLGSYDVIVNCACSKTEILTLTDLARMKPNALLIDIGGDCVGNELYLSQSIFHPIIMINDGNNPVYCVGHVPTLVFKTATKYNSMDVSPYLNHLANGNLDDVLKGATVIDQGRPIKERLL